jgi:hypothetical protein
LPEGQAPETGAEDPDEDGRNDERDQKIRHKSVLTHSPIVSAAVAIDESVATLPGVWGLPPWQIFERGKKLYAWNIRS